jgi:hypothetical protein
MPSPCPQFCQATAHPTFVTYIDPGFVFAISNSVCKANFLLTFSALSGL